MNRKTFLILIGLLVVLGGAGLAVFWQDLSAWRSAGTKIGSKPFAQLPVNEVAQIRLYDGKAAEANYETLAPKTLATPRNIVRTKPGY